MEYFLIYIDQEDQYEFIRKYLKGFVKFNLTEHPNLDLYLKNPTISDFKKYIDSKKNFLLVVLLANLNVFIGVYPNYLFLDFNITLIKKITLDQYHSIIHDNKFISFKYQNIS